MQTFMLKISGVISQASCSPALLLTHTYLEVLIGKLLKGIVGARTLIVLHGGRVPPLEGGEFLDTVSLAEGLALGGAVNIANEGSLVPVKSVNELRGGARGEATS